MTPPPSSTSPVPSTSGMTRPPNASVPSSQWGSTPPPPSTGSQWGTTGSPSSAASQMGQYNMKGYAPGPWLSGGQGKREKRY